MTEPRIRTPNRARVRYDRDELLSVLAGFFPERADQLYEVADRYEVRRSVGADKPCQSWIMHGPGHQSASYCELTGEHEEHSWDDGRYTWTGDHGSTGVEW